MGNGPAKELRNTLKQLEKGDQGSLTELNLPCKGIDDAIAARIASALEHCTAIVSIDLRSNMISSVGSRTLAKVVGR